MAKKICEDKANLLLNEKVSLNIYDKQAQEYLDRILHDNNFWVKGNQLIEITSALGTGAFVEFVENEKIVIDYINTQNIFPLRWENGKIIDCAFASAIQHEGNEYIYLNIHVLQHEGYVVYNKVLKNEKENYIEVALFNGMAEEFTTKSQTPLFQVIMPNIVNNIDYDVPMGVSVFANAIDVLKTTDLVYDSLSNEFELGKKRIFIDASLTQVAMTSNGAEITPVFDPTDVCFYALPMREQDKKEMLHEVNMELRTDDHEKALCQQLNLLSAKCGFGQSYYSFEKGNLKTATEVISENSDLYRNIKKDEIILEKALIDMVKAIIFLSNTVLNAGLPEAEEITIDFDDSIIEDTAAERQGALIEYNSGLIGAIEYFKITRNLDDEGAESFWKEQQKSLPRHAQIPVWDGE